MIAPVSAAVLRVVPAGRHGVASAAVVVARMTGMLVGVAALIGVGAAPVRRAHGGPAARRCRSAQPQADYDRLLADYDAALSAALLTQYREIFLGTAALCLVGAVLCVLLPARRPRRLEPAAVATT